MINSAKSEDWVLALRVFIKDTLGTSWQIIENKGKVRLVEIGLRDGTCGYTAVSAIQSALGFLQSGIIDWENKQEIKKIRKTLEQLNY